MGQCGHFLLPSFPCYCMSHTAWARAAEQNECWQSALSNGIVWERRRVTGGCFLLIQMLAAYLWHCFIYSKDFRAKDSPIFSVSFSKSFMSLSVKCRCQRMSLLFLSHLVDSTRSHQVSTLQRYFISDTCSKIQCFCRSKEKICRAHLEQSLLTKLASSLRYFCAGLDASMSVIRTPWLQQRQTFMQWHLLRPDGHCSPKHRWATAQELGWSYSRGGQKCCRIYDLREQERAHHCLLTPDVYCRRPVGGSDRVLGRGRGGRWHSGRDVPCKLMVFLYYMMQVLY